MEMAPPQPLAHGNNVIMVEVRPKLGTRNPGTVEGPDHISGLQLTVLFTEIFQQSLNETEMPHQFRNRAKMSTEDAIDTVLHAAQSHLEQRGNFLPRD